MVFRRLLSLFLLMMFLGQAGQAETPSPFQVHEVRDRVYVLTRLWEPGTGNNMGVIVGDDGLLLINSMMVSDSEALEKVLKQLSDKPVKYVLNSNWDPYNTQGNAYFAGKGALVIAQENVVYAPRDASYEPTFHQLLFRDRLTLKFAGETIHMVRSGGHSFGHVNIRLDKANVVFMADSFRSDWLGITGEGGLKGHFAGLDQALERSDDETVYISGSYAGKLLHKRTDIAREKAIRKQVAARVGAMVQRGKTADEIAADPALIRILDQNYPVMMKRLGGISPQEINMMLRTDFGPELPTAKVERERYTGRYQAPGGETLEVYEQEGRLFARSRGRFMVALMPLAEDQFGFVHVENGEKISFVRDGEGRVTGLRPDMGGSYYARRIPAGLWRKL